MEKKIFKYEVAVEDLQSIKMPMGAQILCVQTQRGRPHIWALVDPAAKLVDYDFRLYGTGHPISNDETNTRKYIGTFQYNILVFHLFQI